MMSRQQKKEYSTSDSTGVKMNENIHHERETKNKLSKLEEEK